MKISDKAKGISTDLINSILGVVAMNGVVQLVLYPYLNEQMGAERFGNVLTLLSIVSVLGATFGTAANYSRMLSHTKGTEPKGDYNRFLCWIAILAVGIAIVSDMWIPMGNTKNGIGYYLLLVFSVLRYYADVEFRLCLNYRKYCIYYLLVAVGYLIGVALYSLTESWILAILLGEVLAVAYVVINGTVFRGEFFEKSGCYRENLHSFLHLSATQLIAIAVLNSDRLILREVCGGTAVTVFYTATLIGKIVSLVSTPLNSVLIGHLSNYKGRFTAGLLVKICVCTIPMGVILNLFCVFGAHIFTMWRYKDIYDMVKPYLWLANAGQVFYFISGTLMVLLMRFAEEKYQLYINVAYFVAFLILAIPMTMKWNVWGMAWAMLIGNLLRIFFICLGGSIVLKGQNNETEQDKGID